MDIWFLFKSREKIVMLLQDRGIVYLYTPLICKSDHDILLNFGNVILKNC